MKLEDVIQRGTAAARPTPSSVAIGTLYFSTDTNIIERSNGSTWQSFSGAGTGSNWTVYGPSSLVTAPPTTSWSWDNQSSATITSTVYNTEMLSIASGLGTGLHMRYRTAPAAPYTITGLFHANYNTAVAFLRLGLNFRESSTGKIAGIHVRHDGSSVASVKYTNSTTFSADYAAPTIISAIMHPLIWLRIADDNVNRIVSLSWDGYNFHTVHSVGRTDFLTADQVGFHIQSEGGGLMYMHLVSWAAA